MAFSFGFYNSYNHDRKYDAVQMSMIFDGLILDGVYATVGKCFVVKSTTQENMVIVQPGRAWFNHTWNYNDADLPVKCFQSEIITDRIDALVIDINSDENVRMNKLVWVRGKPSSEPVRPILVNTDTHHQYPLCYIYRRANTEIINQQDITNMVGTSACPFVTGILETIDIDELLLQWQDEWNQFVVKYEKEVATWTKKQKDDFTKFYNEFKIQMNEFEETATSDFNSWFSGLKDVLDENAAGHLLNLINANTDSINSLDSSISSLTTKVEEISQEEFEHYYGLVEATTTIDKNSKVIVTSSDEGTSTTRFQDNGGGNKTIKTSIVPNSGNYNYVKTTTIVKTDTENTIKTIYTRNPK